MLGLKIQSSTANSTSENHLQDFFIEPNNMYSTFTTCTSSYTFGRKGPAKESNFFSVVGSSRKIRQESPAKHLNLFPATRVICLHLN